MYGWTRMGARVIITPGGVTPANFSHPLLASVRVLPQPVAAQETKADAAAIQAPEKLEAKAAEISADVGLELRPTVGHAVEMKAAGEASSKVQTADASGALPAALSTASDATSVSGHVSPRTDAAVSDKVDPVKRDASGMVAETEAAKPNDPATMKPDEAASAEVKPKAADPETKPADVVNTQPANAETTASEAAKPGDDAAKTTPPADAVKAATAPPSAPTTTNEAPLKADLKSDFAKADLYTPLKKTEQVAVFVSRKDSKLYVRQGFAPLFDVPVTIAADERPLGTHVFTAQVDKHDANVLRWSVVSLPTVSIASARHAEESHGRKIASTAPIAAKPAPTPDSPAEALNRLDLPAEVMAKIYEAVATGGSIIVSDQGIAGGETGEGTDFIVSLR